MIITDEATGRRWYVGHIDQASAQTHITMGMNIGCREYQKG
jgi:hypothetical protein